MESPWRGYYRDEDAKHEQEAAAIIEREWNCKLHSLGILSPVDWIALRDGEGVALIELKARTCARLKYPTVYLSVRKWLALLDAGNGLYLPGVFVVRWTDALGWKNIDEIAPERITLAGRKRRRVFEGREAPPLESDIEPMIEVPVEDFHLYRLDEPKGGSS